MHVRTHRSVACCALKAGGRSLLADNEHKKTTGGAGRRAGVPAPASSPAREGQYHLALTWVTTGFGMGPGGSTSL